MFTSFHRCVGLWPFVLFAPALARCCFRVAVLPGSAPPPAPAVITPSVPSVIARPSAPVDFSGLPLAASFRRPPPVLVYAWPRVAGGGLFSAPGETPDILFTNNYTRRQDKGGLRRV